jgi:hypothetical protein
MDVLTIDAFLPAPSTELTAADLDEWIADVTASSYDVGHWPYDWALNWVAGLLNRPMPHRRYATKELLGLLVEAKAGGETR